MVVNTIVVDDSFVGCFMFYFWVFLDVLHFFGGDKSEFDLVKLRFHKIPYSTVYIGSKSVPIGYDIIRTTIMKDLTEVQPTVFALLLDH
jgi:hypothetical protein